MSAFGPDPTHGQGTSARASCSTAPLPSRRRNLAGPLHPANRPAPKTFASPSSSSSMPSAPGFVPTLSSPLRASDSPEPPQPSVFLSNNALSRKRSHFSASTYTPSTPPAPAPPQQRQYGAYTAVGQQHSSPVDVPDLDCDASWLSSSSHQQQGSPSAARHGSWARKSAFHGASLLAEPQSSTPARPPQGEFSFNAQTLSGPSLRELPSSMYAQHQDGETSSSAFARLAQAQRHQQESRRLAASGAANAAEEHRDGPPTKKQKGVTSTIVSGALNAALYTGAAALTAYSLWSSWGRKADDEDEDDGQERTRRLSHEKLPPGALVDEPPPPYVEQSMSTSSSRAKSVASTASPALPSQRPVHVFVSSRRRRPVFAQHRSSRGTPKRNNGLGPAAASTPSNTTDNTNASFADASGMDTVDDEDDDDDEAFRRFQAKMSRLIEEGTRALSSKADISAMDLEDNDEEPSQSLSYNRNSMVAPQSALPDPPIAGAANGESVAPFSQSQSALTLGANAHRRPYDDLADCSGSAARTPAALVSPTRAPLLTLASRDPNSPYGRMTRPSPNDSSPATSSRRRL